MLAFFILNSGSLLVLACQSNKYFSCHEDGEATIDFFSFIAMTIAMYVTKANCAGIMLTTRESVSFPTA